MGAYCRWYDKEMRDVTEHEQEQCAENGQDCCECPDLVVKETKEKQGSKRTTVHEFEASGGCEGCQFYQNIENEMERRTCTFPWSDVFADEWDFSKNCDEMEDSE